MDVRRRFDLTARDTTHLRLRRRSKAARAPHAIRLGDGGRRTTVLAAPGYATVSEPAATLALLGAPRVRTSGVWRALPPVRWVALLAYVARAGTWVRREALAAAFWPEHDRDRAYVNLRQALQSIARSPAGDAFEREPARVAWRGASDVAAFEAQVRANAWRTAVATYAGPFLDGYEEVEATPFQAWLEAERRGLEDRWRASVSGCAIRLMEVGRGFEAIELADRLVRFDPYDEGAVRLVMQAAASHGDWARGARAYRALCRALEEELGVEPEAATRELASDLLGAARRR